MCVIGSEKLISERYEIFRLHLSAPFWVSLIPGLCGLVLKPLAKGFDFLFRIRREQMFDGHIRWRNQDRFRMRESVKAGLAVVITNAGRSNTTEGHRFDKQMNVYLIDRAAAE